jgi:hypothetical protein
MVRCSEIEGTGGGQTWQNPCRRRVVLVYVLSHPVKAFARIKIDLKGKWISIAGRAAPQWHSSYVLDQKRV